MYPSRNVCVAGNPHGGVKTPPYGVPFTGALWGAILTAPGKCAAAIHSTGGINPSPTQNKNAVSAQEAAFLYDFQNSLSTGYSPSSLIFFRASTSSGLSSR